MWDAAERMNRAHEKPELAPRVKDGHLFFPLSFAHSYVGEDPEMNVMYIDVPINPDGTFKATLKVPEVNLAYTRRLNDKAFDDAEAARFAAMGEGHYAGKGRWFGKGGSARDTPPPKYPRDMASITVSGKLETRTMTPARRSSDGPLTGPAATVEVEASGTVANETERPRMKFVVYRLPPRGT